MMRMRLAGVVAAAVLVVIPAREARAQLGVKGGLSFATLSNAHPDFKTRTGFAGGVALSIGTGPVVLQPEGLFVRKHAARDIVVGNEPPTIRVDYLELPVFVRLNLPVGRITPYAMAGAMYNMVLNCDLVGGGCPDYIAGSDYGVALAGGIRFGPRGLSVEGRYTWGLKEISEISTGLDQRTRTFLLLVGIGL